MFEIPEEQPPIMILAIQVYDEDDLVPSVELIFNDELDIQWKHLDALNDGIQLAKNELELILREII